MSEYKYLTVHTKPEGTVVSLLSHVLKIDLMRELRDAVYAAAQKPIVITGRNGYFAAGADISELTQLSGPNALDYARLGQQVMNTIADSASTTVAAIDGYCVGGGFDLALACNLRYATAESVLAHPGGRIGIMTGWGGTQRLPQLVGKSRALEMMVVGRRLPAAEAFEWGLIHSIVQDPVTHALMDLKRTYEQRS